MASGCCQKTSLQIVSSYSMPHRKILSLLSIFHKELRIMMLNIYTYIYIYIYIHIHTHTHTHSDFKWTVQRMGWFSEGDKERRPSSQMLGQMMQSSLCCRNNGPQLGFNWADRPACQTHKSGSLCADTQRLMRSGAHHTIPFMKGKKRVCVCVWEREREREREV